MHRRDDGVKNSPFAIIGVLAIVLGTVGVIALAGRAVQPIAGTATAVSGGSGVVMVPPGTSVAGVPRVIEPGRDPVLAEDTILRDVTCGLPALGHTDDSLRGFYTAALGCLDDAWRPVLKQAAVRFGPAGLDIAPDAVSDCGEMPSEDEATAFYCSADQIIYMPSERLLEFVGVSQPAHLAVLAHEYGHHVQNLSGTLDRVAAQLVDLDGGSAKELELTRRIELQANCFAGLFLASVAGRGSVPRSVAMLAVNGFGNSVASDTHGTLVNQMRWARTGFQADTVTECDTWTAPVTAVS